jgi:thiamine biosynthesis protein ThiI
MNPDLLIARFGELWLKGANRTQFTQRLTRNVKGALTAAGVRGARVRVDEARLFVEPASPDDVPAAFVVLRETPGIANVSACVRVEKRLETLAEVGAALARRTWTEAPTTWVCRARRIDKHFPQNAPLIERTVAEQVGLAIGVAWKVDLRTPKRTLFVEVLRDMACVSAWNEDGIGGLPVGTAGRALLLLSGGLDSPVAGYLAQKRGCELEAVYFHSPPFIAEASRDKVTALARTLGGRQGGLTLHVVHFTEIQEAIHTSCDPKLTVILYRRFMYRIATALAHRRGALALCTGENLGQVASQTLENLTLVDRIGDLMTLRPLMAFDKHETVAIAHRIGTYETSILPAEDCCTLFVPRHPAVRAPLSFVEHQETKLDVQGLVDRALSRTESVRP